MAFAATTAWNVRTTGSDSNGGGFDSSLGGTDYSQQDSAQATGTVTSASTTVTATSGIFTSVMVGNFITDGTTWKEITAYTSSTIVTVDSAPSWTAASIKVGGGLATISKSLGLVVAGNTVNVKASASYTESIALTTTAGTETAPITLSGYTTTIGDNGKVTVDAQNTRANCGSVNESWYVVKNFIFTNATTRAFDFTSAVTVNFSNCQFLKGSGSGNLGLDSSTFNIIPACLVNCYFLGFTTYAVNRFVNGTMIGCEISGCGPLSISSYGGNLKIVNCLFHGGAGPAIDIGSNSSLVTILGCTIDGKTGASGSCIHFAGSTDTVNIVANCILSNAATYGLDCAINFASLTCFNNAYYNNATANYNNQSPGMNDVILTASPYVGSGNYGLNSTAGGGTACKAAGLPGAMPGGGGTSYLDIGALQHQASGGGGGGTIIVRSTGIASGNIL